MTSSGDISRVQTTVDEHVRQLRELEKRITQMEVKHDNLTDDVRNCVTKAEFAPIKAVVYGGAGSILMGVLSAILIRLGISSK